MIRSRGWALASSFPPRHAAPAPCATDSFFGAAFPHPRRENAPARGVKLFAPGTAQKGFGFLNAFEILGLSASANEQQLRQAYHDRVKACHPDQFSDAADQQKAQEKLVQINLAYEEAMRQLQLRQQPLTCHKIPAAQAKQVAKKLLDQQRYESALLQLSRADVKDDEWYYIQGQLLMGMRQWGTAHQSFREAVRLQPENLEYRRGALDAAVAVKKHQKWPYRVLDWADQLIHRR